jgi:CubicO group peptidase (beta-lactamase class C family)
MCRAVFLHMASGVAFTEVYDGADDNAKLGRQRFAPNGPGAVRALADFSEREAPQGTRFHYASSESQVLGLVLANAVHRSLAAYLQNRIWQPMSAEADAAWGVDPAELEGASCCLNAVLRDWARHRISATAIRSGCCRVRADSSRSRCAWPSDLHRSTGVPRAGAHGGASATGQRSAIG